jgi:hypothetical protein
VSVPVHDRRRPQESIADLRRHLREADQQRFELEATIAGAAGAWLDSRERRAPVSRAFRRADAFLRETAGWRRSAVVALFALGAGAVIGSHQPRTEPEMSLQPTVQAAASESTAPPMQPLPRPIANITQQAPATNIPMPAENIEARAAAADGAPRSTARRSKAPRRPAAEPSGSAARQPAAHTLRSRPRPLSPGEFGRPR